MKLNQISLSGAEGHELFMALERYISNTPLDVNEQLHFEEIPLHQYALEAQAIEPRTALHKVLSDLAYVGFYLYDYDDVDGYSEYREFAQYALDMFAKMRVPPPPVFLSGDDEAAVTERHIYSQLFVDGLEVFVQMAFEIAWNRKQLLYKFNQLLANQIRPLLKADFPNLAYDGRHHRAASYPVWLVNMVNNRERGLCHYDGRPVSSALSLDFSPHMDHMVAIANGGTNDATNFVLSCSECNLKKGVSALVKEDVAVWPRY